LVTDAVSIDANLRQVRASLGEALDKNKPITKKRSCSPIKAKNKPLVNFIVVEKLITKRCLS
jgi:hypothetical protein